LTPDRGRILLFHDVPAPYRLRVFNRLGELAEGRLTLLFHTTAGMQDQWKVPVDELTCDWRFVATRHGWRYPLATLKAVFATVSALLRLRPSVVICSGYASWPGWICLIVGILAIVLAMVMNRQRSRTTHIQERRDL